MRLPTILLAAILLSGCSGWTYNGIRGQDLRHPTWSMAAGFATTFAVHTAGHLLAAHAMGYDCHISGTSEIIDGPMDAGDARVFAAAGYGAQLAVGYGMKLWGVDNDFTRGYNAGTMLEIVAYPVLGFMRSGGGNDLDYFAANGGDKDVLYGVASTLAVGLNVKRRE